MKKNGFTLIEIMVVGSIIGVLGAILSGQFIIVGTNGEGSRSGLVTKLSEKGIIWKTWEGTLMLGSGNSGESWDFTVFKNERKDELLNKIKTAQEKDEKITLEYKQHLFVPRWEGDTTYEIVGIK